MARNLLKSSLENASFNIVFQILCRCITFVINAWVIRNVGYAALGIMNVRLLLLESTILFLSREPFQRACLGNKNECSWTQIVNQIWLSVPISIALSVIFVYVWLYVLPLGHPEFELQYFVGCLSMALSCILEMTSESMVIVAQIFCFVKLKVALDSLHVFSRTFVFLIIVVNNTNLAIIAFSIAQVVSGIVIASSYFTFFYFYIKYKPLYKNDKIKIKYISKNILRSLYDNMDDFPFTSMNQFLPKWAGEIRSSFDAKLCSLTFSFAKQGIVKQLLTEGEKYVMSISPVMSFSEQATYDVVNNLGSLTARFIFRPIEDSSYFYFTQMIKRDEQISAQDQNKVSESCTVLLQICKTVTSIGLIVLVFGQSYAYTLLLLYGGKSFVEGGLSVQLLRSHCLAVILLAINGITECYAFATMTTVQLNSYNYLMVFFSISFLALSYILTYLLGPVGFIISNCINMLARIIHSIHFINAKYYGTSFKPLNGFLVGKTFLITLVASGFIVKISELTLDSQILHILIGALCLFFVILAWSYNNRDLLRIGYSKYFKKEKSSQE